MIHGNDNVVLSDSEGEYEDIQTLESSDGELFFDKKENKKVPDKHKLDFLDDWDDEDNVRNVISNSPKIEDANSKDEKDANQSTDVEDASEGNQENLLRPTCMFCHATFFSFEAVEDHVKLLHGDGMSDLKLEIDPQKHSTSNISSSTAHSAAISNGSNKEEVNVSLKKCYKCNLCGIRRVSFHCIQVHKNTHKKEIALQCKFCGSKFKKIVSLKVHQFKCRKVTSAFKKCKHCQFKFFHVTDLKKHVKNVHLKKYKKMNDDRLNGLVNQRQQLDSLNNSFNQMSSTSLEIGTRHKMLKTNLPNKKVPKLYSYNHRGQKYQFECDQCGEVFVEKARKDDHEGRHRIQQCLDFNICICCHKIFVDRVHLDIHSERMHKQWFSGKECPLCKREFFNNRSLKFHYLRYHISNNSYELVKQITDLKKRIGENKVHGKMQKNVKDTIGDVSQLDIDGENSFTLIYSCPINRCSFNSEDQVLMKNHTKKHHVNYCYICKNIFKNSIFNYHKRYHTRAFQGKECTLCKGLFHDDIHLLHHLQCVHPDLKNKCNLCADSFFTLAELAQHKSETHGKMMKKVSTCGECQMEFNSKKLFQNHKEFSHRVSLSCKYCDKDFIMLKKLVIHENNHLKQATRVFKCSTCGKVLKTKTSLKIHKMNHTNNNPLSCKTCGQKSRSSCYMREHIASHSEEQEKKYFCGICGKGFYFYDSHCRHRRFHLDPSLLQCTACNEKFKTIIKLAKHRQICKGPQE